MIKNVLPFFLDGGIQEASGATYWNGTSSFVESTGNAAVVVDVKSPSGRPVKPGTLLTVTNRGGTIVSVSPLADFSANDDTININDSGASVLLMFKGPSDTNKLGEWVVLSKFQADTDTDTVFTGGTVSGATTFESGVTLESDATLGDSNSDKVEVNGKLVKGNITVTDVDAQNHTLTAAEFLTGIVLHTSVTGAGSITFDTAANLISTLELEADNEVATCLYINDGTENVTLNGGTPSGVTYVNNPTIAAEGSATLVVRRTGASAVQVIIA